ncbi:hypothetical protein GCM10027035_21260 [Emticicia sediminis]|jgi:hypothetical protein
MSVVTQKLTNVQVELLNTFAYELPEEELKDLKKVLVGFFAKRIRQQTSKIWEEKGYTSETMKDWLNDENQ